jgi:hypothetical protein
MKCTSNTFLKGAIAIFAACASLASAQLLTPPHGYTTVIPVPPSQSTNSVQGVVSSATPLPLWTYTVNAGSDLGGGTYTGTILGRSPYLRGKGTTTIPTQIVPLVITINNGAGNSVTYDPTAVDPCVTGVHTDVDVITGSPIFTNNDWTMNGVAIGNTQYIDAFQRAEFWSLVGGSAYHLVLQPSVLAGQSLSFGSNGTKGPGTNYNATQFGGCGNIGVVNINNMDNAIQALIQGPLAAMVNVGTFPIFLTKNVVMAETGTSIFHSCCILGYHSGFNVGPNLQIYSPFSIDTSGVFGGDVSTLSHEMAEAVNDPTGNNPTPVWGNIGQVLGGCQNNFEVGDPLSPGFGTPTNPFTVSQNGLTYHMQELAFFSWFYGGTPLGSGGKFSNNGSFGGNAILCPPGGTK